MSDKSMPKSRRLPGGVIRKTVTKCIGQYWMGYIEQRLRPPLTESWEGAFNKQEARRKTIDDLFHSIQPKLFIETGTFRGTTTEYICKTYGLPTITIEVDPYNAGYAGARLRKDEVEVINLDTRAALHQLVERETIPKQNVLFYLDAHWDDDLPLTEELTLISKGFSDYVVIIDDFRVPGDEGYGYDNYGAGKILDINLVRDFATKNSARLFFPTVPSEQESGSKRGMVVISSPGGTGDRLATLGCLREHVL